MKQIEGKIDWLPNEPGEYQGKPNIGIKVKGTFYNRYGTKPELTSLLQRIKVGYLVKIDIDEENKILALEVLSDKVEEKKGEFDADNLTSFEELLADAHTKGLHKVITQHIEIDLEKKYALFKAVVLMKVGDEIKEFQAYGDTTDDNIKGGMIKPHFIRMAETRAISRALRWATNNAKCSKEETAEEIPEKEAK